MNLRQLFTRPATRRARSRITRMEEATLEEQLAIVRIPAPSLAEERRARHILERFESIGLGDCQVDAAGNVLARMQGSERPDESPVVIAAHLDTVFAADVEIAPRTEGSRVYAPGITDNARGLAAMLAVADALHYAEVVPRRPLWFVGTVGEEGNGDLLGVKHLLTAGGPASRPSAFIALDGSGIRRIVHRAVGARRLRVQIAGPGGHSWSDWGSVNPLHAASQCVARLATLPGQAAGSATLTVARAGGGTSVNAIPQSAWFEVDLRSERQEAIAEFEAAARRVVRDEVDRADAARKAGTAALTVEIRVIGDRPSGAIPEDAPLVAAAAAATRVVGAVPELVASSTDANVPLSMGIPAVTLGAGGESGGIHTVDEWFCGRGGAAGLERGLLTVLAATELP